jgi:hypothetical protein
MCCTACVASPCSMPILDIAKLHLCIAISDELARYVVCVASTASALAVS